jgi:SAM-dependent methyltransferase
MGASHLDRVNHLLDSAGVGSTLHPTGTLLAHLRATHHRLQRWGCATHVCVAGLCHSVYGTERFDTATFTFADRDRVREHIGAEAEELVYLFCVAERPSLYANVGRPGPHRIVDRRTREPVALRDSQQLADLVTLDAANALGQPFWAISLWRQDVDRRRFERAAPLLPGAAMADVRSAYHPHPPASIGVDTLKRGTRRIVRRIRGERELTVGKILELARRGYRRTTIGVRNPFTSPTAAQRYAEGRPDYHEEIARQVAAFLGHAVPIGCAVDVGCGTGQSTRAMARLSRRIVGVDVSESMVREARARADHPIVLARAESLPLRTGSADAIFASAAFHWFDQPRFLAEARRVARPSAWLIVYDNGFSGVVEGVDEVRAWHHDWYLRKFPPRPSNATFSPRLASRAGFEVRCAKRYVNHVDMDAASLARFLVTQSNVLGAVEAGTGTADEFAGELRAQLAPFFRVNGTDVIRACEFGGPLSICALAGKDAVGARSR